jgi:methylated-DNA-[protein]-cysteine S-methyltransferase
MNFPIMYLAKYQTPKAFDNILLISDGKGLTGLFFEGSKSTEEFLAAFRKKQEEKLIAQAKAITAQERRPGAQEKVPATLKQAQENETFAATYLKESNNSNNNEKSLYLNEGSLPIFEETAAWLDIYFRGEQPDFTPALRTDALSEFRKRVLDIVREIPYGKTVSYKYIAERIAAGLSARAVGGAVGANPISIIIPCHRVIGADGSMTGYGGGLKNKIALLELEGKKTLLCDKK